MNSDELAQKVSELRDSQQEVIKALTKQETLRRELREQGMVVETTEKGMVFYFPVKSVVSPAVEIKI